MIEPPITAAAWAESFMLLWSAGGIQWGLGSEDDRLLVNDPEMVAAGEGLALARVAWERERQAEAEAARRASLSRTRSLAGKRKAMTAGQPPPAVALTGAAGGNGPSAGNDSLAGLSER